MKKRCAMALVLAALMLLSGFALADAAVSRSGALAAYLDGAGGLYLPGNPKAVNTAPADTLVSIDPYRVLFLSKRGDGACDLYMIDLGDFHETLLASGAYTAAMDGDDLYYVPAANRAQLMRMDPDNPSPALVYTAAEPIDRLQRTAEGLTLELVDAAGAVLHVNLTDSFEAYLSDVPRVSALTDAFEVYLTGNDLYLRDTTGYTAEYVDSGVQDFCVMNGVVYYVAGVGSAMQLKSYDPAATSWQTLLTLDVAMERQVAATGESLFMIDLSRQIYQVDLAGKRLTPFARVPADSNYKIASGYQVSRLRLEGMTGQLNVYAELEEAASQPDFSFIEFTSASDALNPKLQLLETYAIDGEASAWTALKPAAQYSPLSRGSRGEAVSAIQDPLYTLGYYDYYIDGIFGPRTEAAVRMVQADMNRAVTGIADSELQRMLLEGQVPHYDAFLALTRGNRGLRVQTMQERLRDLGFLADSADGIFGANTQRAVQLFQSENGLSVSDGATRETLKRLYSDDALACTSYIDLYPGNTGSRVRALNNRLHDLYYLTGNPGSVYTRETAEAVRSYQRTAGLRVTGIATGDVQRRLFSRYAPEAPGYITLRRGDDNDRVAALQRRLRDLDYYAGSVDGYFGRATEKAVELFQKKVGLSASGVATVRTQELLFRKDAPVYVKPTIISDPEIVLDCFHHYSRGVYYISDSSTDTGYISFSWYVEGEAESYRVRIRDDKKRTYIDEDTYLSRTGFSLYTLEYDRLYTLTVTAYPEDGDSRHITSASVDFMRIEDPEEPEEPAVGIVGEPEIGLASVTRVQDGIRYVAPGKVSLTWHADGEVQSYAIEVLDSDGDTWLSKTTTDEGISVKSTSMAVGEVYTLLVYAIPENGTIEDATVAADFFALEDISVPTPSPEPENWDLLPSTVIEEEEVQDKAPEETPAPETTPEPVEATPAPTAEVLEEEAPAFVEEETPVYVEEAPADEAAAPDDAEALPEPTPAPVAAEPEPEAAEPEPEAAEAEPEATEAEPEAAEAEPAAAEAEPEAPVITLAPDADVTPREPAEPEIEAPAVGVPELSFETVLDADENITYLADDVVVLHWHSEGAAAYYVEIFDQNGLSLAHTATDQESLPVKPGNFQPGQVYTLSVIPMNGDGEKLESAAATRLLALYPTENEAAPEPQPAEAEPQASEPEEPQYTEEAPQYTEEEPQYTEEEQYTEEPQYTEEEPQYTEEEQYTEEPQYIEEEPYVDEPQYTEEEPYVEEPQYTEEEPYVEEPQYTEEEPYVEEPQYTEEEPYTEEPYIEEEPYAGEDPWSMPLTASSDSGLISQVQSQLAAWGWLGEGGYESGVLDEATLQAVRDFQSAVNERSGAGLMPAESTVSPETLNLLMYGQPVYR